jgi:hypothetical protein
MANWKVADLFDVFGAIFFHERSVDIQGVTYKRSLVGANFLRAFQIKEYLIIEQNPTKRTSYAKQAREGKRIAWIISPHSKKWWRIEDDLKHDTVIIINDKNQCVATIDPSVIADRFVTRKTITQ